MVYDPDLEVGSRLEAVLTMIGKERKRQDVLKAAGRFAHTAFDSELDDYERFAMLGEEFGEVAKQVLTQPDRRLAYDTAGTPDKLRKELIQVAAVATAWVEGMLYD